MDATPKRRWYQFSVRSLFVVITLFGIWLGWQLYWFKTRRDWLEAQNYVAAFPAAGARKLPHPQLLITLFHQEAMSQILLRNASQEEIAKVQRLFPEADVVSGNWGAPSLGDPVYVGKRALPGPGDLPP
jgi:hypothetical protein